MVYTEERSDVITHVRVPQTRVAETVAIVVYSGGCGYQLARDVRLH